MHPVPEPSAFLSNHHIVSTHHPLLHPSIGRKRPVFDAITAFPDHGVVRVPVFVPKLDADPVAVLREQFLAQPVLPLPVPFLGQEPLNLGVAAEEGAAVAPDGGRGVGSGHLGGVPGVPEGLGGLHLLVGAFEGEGGSMLCHGVAQILIPADELWEKREWRRIRVGGV